MSMDKILVRLSPKMYELYKSHVLPTALIRQALYNVIDRGLPKIKESHSLVKDWEMVLINVDKNYAETYRAIAFRYRPYFYVKLDEEIKKLLSQVSSKILDAIEPNN